MLTTIDILSQIEEQKTTNITQLAHKLKIPTKALKEILIDLNQHNLVEYNQTTGTVKLPNWLAEINKEFEETAPTTGEIILPRFQEIKIQDIAVGNYTKQDLELKIRINNKIKEIAICDLR